MTGSREHWSVDKKIPLALMLAILAQTGAGVWWASALNTRVTSVETHSIQVDTTLTKIAADSATADVRTARLEERYSAIEDTLKRLDDKMDKVLDQQRPVRGR